MAKKNDLLGSMVNSVQSEIKKIDERFDKADDIMLRGSNINSNVISNKSVKVLVTMPPKDRDILNSLVDRALNLRRNVNKSELIRISINEFNTMSDKQLLELIDNYTTKK